MKKISVILYVIIMNSFIFSQCTPIEVSVYVDEGDFSGYFDCNGECYGEAVIDGCEVCSGGSTGLEISEYTDVDNFTGAFDCNGLH